MENRTPIIGSTIADLEAKAFLDNKFTTVRLSDYRGKWVVLFFYPADFTFVCPTELGELADHYVEFKQLNTEILSVSTDTEFVHMAWHDHSPTIKKIAFPMVADPTGNWARELGVYISEAGLSLRGTFIIDPDGKIIAEEINDNSIGRSVSDLLRKLQAAQYVRENNGEVCPASWKPGNATLKPSEELVGKI